MKLHGDNLQANQVVTVNGKIVSADVKELDTDEGWVDIFLPVFNEEAVTIQSGDNVAGGVSYFDTEVKRLIGEIKVVELTVPAE